MLYILAQPKGQQQIKKTKQNKKTPELPENQTVWKSNNQGVKEETFIHTGRRGGDGKPGQMGVARQQTAGEKMV